MAHALTGSFALYGSEHRLPALYYMNYGFVAVLVAAVFTTALVFLLLPVLKARRATLAVGSLMLFTALTQSYAFFIPEWQVATARMRDVALSYWPGSPLMDCSIWLGIGLNHANITLICEPFGDPYYNEYLSLDAQDQALRSSLLAPLQAAAIPIIGDSGIFLRRAGQWAYTALLFSCAIWAWALILFVAVPASAGCAIRFMGLVMISAPIIYHCLQRQPLTAALPGASAGLQLKYGSSFWLCMVAGIATTISGVIIEILAYNAHKCSTACELDSFIQAASRRNSIISTEDSLPPNSEPTKIQKGSSAQERGALFTAE